MTVTTYRPQVVRGAARILDSKADLLDQCADLIAGTGMTASEAQNYLRGLAKAYRVISSEVSSVA